MNDSEARDENTTAPIQGRTGAGDSNEHFTNHDHHNHGHHKQGGKPNGVLLTEIAEESPGRALDAGCGEGADAIWLAERGWQVTAVDISTVALERGRKQAGDLDIAIARQITWRQDDLTEWEPPAASFDLVSTHFMQLPSAQRAEVYQRLADSVAPGGVLLIVGHHPSDLETTAERRPDPDPLFTARELVEELGDGWTILTQETRPRAELDPTGESTTVHDAVLVARRNNV